MQTQKVRDTNHLISTEIDYDVRNRALDKKVDYLFIFETLNLLL